MVCTEYLTLEGTLGTFVLSSKRMFPGAAFPLLHIEHILFLCNLSMCILNRYSSLI